MVLSVWRFRAAYVRNLVIDVMDYVVLRGDVMSNASLAASAPEGSDDSLVTRLRGVAAVIVAVVTMVGFAVFVAFLVVKASSANDTSWTRFVYLFGAVEALVFTAFGWLFGREVNRQAAKNAEARADSAQERAETAKSAAADQKARGEALRAGIEARASSAGTTVGYEERTAADEAGGDAAAPRDMDELVTLARTLFP